MIRRNISDTMSPLKIGVRGEGTVSIEQAGVELCQAQFKLGLAKPATANR